MDPNRFLVVSVDAVPEMIVKTLEVKRILARGDAKSAAEACKCAEISRSAFYKYRDLVFSYEEMVSSRIITLTAILRDEPGVLSALLSALYSVEANILTVNQNIPIDGAASVTISMRIDGDVSRISSAVELLSGVAEVRLLVGR